MAAVPKGAWLTRFGRRLMRLRPSLTAVDAAQYSVAAFRENREKSPENVAEQVGNSLADASQRCDGAFQPADGRSPPTCVTSE